MVRAAAQARGPRGIALALLALAGLGGRVARAEPPPASEDTRICVHVFEDRDGDGSQQLPEEGGLAGWSVRVPEGRPTRSLSTDASGVACTSVYAGMTSVQVPSPAGWAPTSRVAMRVLVAAGGTTDVHVGFRREEGAAPATPEPAVVPAPPTGRMGRLTVGAALPAQCRLTSLRVTTTGGTVDLAMDSTIPIGATSLPSADVAGARFTYEGSGGVPSVALVTSTGAVVRLNGTTRALHVRAELPGGGAYEYDWDAGREWGCPAPSSVRFALSAPTVSPASAGRAGEVGRVGLPALEGRITRFRVATKSGSFDFLAPGPIPTSSEEPARTEDVEAVHFFSEGEGDRASLRLMVKMLSGDVHRLPALPDDPILSLTLRVELPGGASYEYAWADGRPGASPVPLVVRFKPAR